MKTEELYTPAVLLDLDVMENNLKRFADAAKKNGKEIWPMLKTHKSLELADRQIAAGATGFLCGTLDEAERLCEAGYDNLMYAYPVAGRVSAARAAALAGKCRFIVRIDGVDGAAILQEEAEKRGVSVPYTVIIDSGLHRFGVKPEEAGRLADALAGFPNLIFTGISTHPGHVYGIGDKSEISRCVEDEKRAVAAAVAAVRATGREPSIVSSGSTPTFFGTVDDENIGIYHPGNYIFNDAIQLSTETATVADCALTVLTTLISHPTEEVFLCDAGAKCLGLDRGAHGNSSILGYGVVAGHPELIVSALSEEVGKLKIIGPTDLRVGDRIRIIPNHSCSSANLTSYYIGVRGDEVDHAIEVTMRDNGTKKNAV